MQDIVHVTALLPLAAVALEVELAQLLLLVRNDEFMLKLALIALWRPKRQWKVTISSWQCESEWSLSLSLVSSTSLVLRDNQIYLKG